MANHAALSTGPIVANHAAYQSEQLVANDAVQLTGTASNKNHPAKELELWTTLITTYPRSAGSH